MATPTLPAGTLDTRAARPTTTISRDGTMHLLVALRNGHQGYGALGTRREDCRCSACDGGSFDYSNGAEWSACGTRGYRCCHCATIKPERVKVDPAFSAPVFP